MSVDILSNSQKGEVRTMSEIYVPNLIHPNLANKIRREWFQDYDIENMDNIRFLNRALEWLRKNGELEHYKEYWFIFSKNDRKVINTKRVILDLGRIHMRTQTTHAYHVFFVREKGNENENSKIPSWRGRF